MADILTRLKIEDRRRIPFRFGNKVEYKFPINFKQNDVIENNNRLISIRLSQRGAPPLIIAPIDIIILRPDGTRAVCENNENEVIPKISPRTLGHIQIPGRAKIPVLDDPIDLDPFPDPVIPPVVPPHISICQYTIKENDPNGIWTIQVLNEGEQDENFDIQINHPDLQLRLVESRVPFSLLNRLIDKIKRLTDLKIKIDQNFELDFSDKFKKMTKLSKITETIGEQHVEVPIAITIDKTVSYTLDNIELDKFKLELLPFDADSITFQSNFTFNVDGENAHVRIAPLIVRDVILTKLELDADIIFRKDQFFTTYIEKRNLAGKIIGTTEPITKPIINVKPDIVVEDDILGCIDIEDRVNDGVESTISSFMKDPTQNEILKTIGIHFTDMLLFLASGKSNQVFYDIKTDGTEFIVRHYNKPSSLIRLKDAQQPQAPGNAGTVLVEQETTGAVATPGRRPQANQQVQFGGIQGPVLTMQVAQAQVNPAEVNAPIPQDPGRKIEHIVVLTLENRSFDHMLGYLTLKKNRNDIDGIVSEALHTNPVPGLVEDQAVFLLNDGAAIKVDPGHNVDEVREQIANGAMSGFVSNYLKKKKIANDPESQKLVMGYYDDNILDFYDFLAREYLICNKWFSSHPGATYPNRFVSVMGSAPEISNFEIGGNQAGAVKGTTIFDILTKEKISWNYVESNIAFLRMFDKYRVDEEKIIQRQQWLDMARNGQLPKVSWIDPHIIDLEIEGEADDDHPPANVEKGQDGVREIYEALIENKAQWAKTLLIITYDEHGGFYDHVPPHGINGEGNPTVHKIHKDGASHYGVRVPTFIVSPWVKRGSASNVVFDHTSILKTILDNYLKTKSEGQELLGKRTDAANSILQLLSRRPRFEAPTHNAPPPLIAFNQKPKKINDRPVSSRSFHDNLLLFGFGHKFRKMVASNIESE